MHWLLAALLEMALLTVTNTTASVGRFSKVHRKWYQNVRQVRCEIILDPYIFLQCAFSINLNLSLIPVIHANFNLNILHISLSFSSMPTRKWRNRNPQINPEYWTDQSISFPILWPSMKENQTEFTRLREQSAALLTDIVQ